jgi:hypothetical protein
MADEGSINSSSATAATLDTNNEAVASAGRKRGSCFNEVENLMIARAFINASNNPIRNYYSSNYRANYNMMNTGPSRDL